MNENFLIDYLKFLENQDIKSEKMDFIKYIFSHFILLREVVKN